jgi:hypothetical protein
MSIRRIVEQRSAMLPRYSKTASNVFWPAVAVTAIRCYGGECCRGNATHVRAGCSVRRLTSQQAYQGQGSLLINLLVYPAYVAP